MFSPSRCTVFTTLVPYFILDQPYCSPSLIYEILIRLGESDPSPDAGPQRLIVFTNLEVRCAPIVRRILKSTWSPSISQSKGRNLLPSFSQVLTQAGAGDNSASRSRVLSTSKFPFCVAISLFITVLSTDQPPSWHLPPRTHPITTVSQPMHARNSTT